MRCTPFTVLSGGLTAILYTLWGDDDRRSWFALLDLEDEQQRKYLEGLPLTSSLLQETPLPIRSQRLHSRLCGGVQVSDYLKTLRRIGFALSKLDRWSVLCHDLQAICCCCGLRPVCRQEQLRLPAVLGGPVPYPRNVRTMG